MPWPESDVERDPEEMTPEEAGEELGMRLVELKVRGVLPATQVCQLAFFAKEAGVKGIVEDFAFAPGKASGSYSKKFDKAVGSSGNSGNLYRVEAAMRSKTSPGRHMAEIPLNLPHEAFLNEFTESSEATSLTRSAIESRELPPAYFDHPVVLANPTSIVHPVCMYVDGVAFTRTDTLLGFRVYPLLTQ